MPPRRARASIPTPADSNKSSTAPSTSSSGASPVITKRKRGGRQEDVPGLATPDSLTDGDMDEVATEIDEEEAIESAESKGQNGTVGNSSDTSVFAPSTTTPPSGSSKGDRYVIDSITLPSSRRSKLGLQQTGSADNMTLGSPIPKKARSSSVMMKSDPPPEDLEKVEEEMHSDNLDEVKPAPKPAGRGKDKHAAQPFSIGKTARVTKATLSDLAFSDEETDTKPPVKRGRKAPATTAKGKGKAPAGSKAVKKEEVMSDGSEVQVPGDDFAMDSDEEERQLKAAIRASAAKGIEDKFGSTTTTEVNSRESSVFRKGGKSVASTPSTGRKSRVAAIRSAEKVKKAIKASNGIKKESEDDDSGSDFGEDASESNDSSSDLSDSDDPLALVTKSNAKSRSKLKSTTKSSAQKNGRGKSFAGKGRKLGGGDAEEESEFDGSDGEAREGSLGMAEEDLDALDEDTRMATLQTMKEDRAKKRKADAERMKPIREAEAALKKELGRKLTNGEKNSIRLVTHHPELQDVWGDLQANVEPIKPVMMEAHPSLKLNLLPFQKESLYWMKEQEKGVWKGGMLADEMGMGKTIQTIALLLSEPRRKPSLVVAPVVALMQWKHEIENNTDGFTVCVWHGQGRMKANDLKKYDVVLVSYGTLEASFRRQARGFKRGDVFIKEQSPMHTFEWFRVILDEAHNIKERSTNAAKAAFALKAQYKWCLSGTPLQNRVGELYSLVRFLGADPFSHYFCKKCDCKSLHWKFSDRRHCDECKHGPMDHVCFWNTEILTPIARYGIEAGGPGHTAFKKLKVLLDRMMLRRTKLERADDLGLPPRTIVVRRDYFSPEEKELYMSLFTGAKRQFATYVGQGTVLNNYSNIFSLITRMRQMACHPDLVLRSKTALVKDIDMSEGTVCRLCQDTAEDAIVSACRHVFDRECIRQYLEVQQNRGHRPECPVCHIEISIDLEQEAVDLEDTSKKARQGILSRLNLNNWRSSSKLEALVEELEKLRNKDCTIKSLVFSQFVSFLDLIAFRLQRAGFNICRLEGGMTPQQRDATIQHFMNNTHVTVFLISLKAGGVALNLTEASMVFMMDSWWNPSVEYQAMDRIHRLGQKRPVKVVKLVVEDSIEDQIVQLQHKKLAMTEAALNKDPDAALGKLTVEDLGFLFKM